MSTESVSTYMFQQLESTAETDRNPEELLAHARAEAEGIRERARAEGEAAGYTAGLERAQADAAPVTTALADAIRSVGATRDELVEKLTSQAGELALLIAEQIVAGAVAAQPERIIDVARAALRRLADRHRVTVLVNPEDLELLSAGVQELQSQLGGIEHLDVQADRRIARGGAIAQTLHGEIDATIAAQLQTARELVEAALAGDTGIVPASDGELGELVLADGL